MTMVDYHPFLLEIREDPYPTYQALRAQDPVHWSDVMGAWVLTRHTDITRVLRESVFSADRFRGENRGRQIPGDMPRSLLALDPPDHTRLRTLVSKAFTPRVVEGLRRRIQDLVDGLLDRLAPQGGMELIADFAYPLPVTVIAEMLGVPPQDWERFRAWSHTLAASLDPMISGEQLQRALAARSALADYFRGIVAERRRAPRDDLITGLIAAEERGDVLSELELLIMCNLLLVAGHETTVNLIGNGLLALLRHPEEAERLRADPGLTETAVEELLRYDSPVQLTSRVAIEDVQVSGKLIRKGQEVITLLGAGNRDPEQFQDPDRLDLGRHPNPHLSFARGIHFCLGAPLARLEGQIALGTLITRFPTLRLTPARPQWRETIVLRGLASLPVSF